MAFFRLEKRRSEYGVIRMIGYNTIPKEENSLDGFPIFLDYSLQLGYLVKKVQL